MSRLERFVHAPSPDLLVRPALLHVEFESIHLFLDGNGRIGRLLVPRVLVAVMDWFSRYVLSWRLSSSPDTDFCMEALERALRIATPDIFNRDQGAPFTCDEFTGRLLHQQVRISTDGRGRAMDHMFVERLWLSLKYEEVYPKEDADVAAAESSLSRSFRYFNCVRPHPSPGYSTPAEVYFAAGRSRREISCLS